MGVSIVPLVEGGVPADPKNVTWHSVVGKREDVTNESCFYVNSKHDLPVQKSYCDIRFAWE